MGEQVLLPTVSSDPCSSQGLEGRGAQAFSPESESPVPPPESHCPGDPSVEHCWPDAQVYLLLWGISKRFPQEQVHLSIWPGVLAPVGHF